MSKVTTENKKRANLHKKVQNRLLKEKGLAEEMAKIVLDGLRAEDQATRQKALSFFWNDIMGFRKVTVEKKTLDDADRVIKEVQGQIAPSYRQDLKPNGDRPENQITH